MNNLIKKIIFLSVTVYLASLNLSMAQNISNDIVIGNKVNFHSRILDENRELQIYLPNSYSNNNYKDYPVIYLLDGGTLFKSFSSVVDILSSDASPQIPEMIVVGINTTQNRLRDASPTQSLVGYRGVQEDGLEVTGGARNFLKFIESELIPYIDSTYRTNSYKIFVGYSFTGLPILHSLFSQKDLFNSYLAIDFSAWWDNQVTLKNLKSFVKNYNSQKSTDIFMSTEDRVKNKVYPPGVNATWTFMKRFKKNHPENINVAIKKYKFKEENHHSMPLISFIDGIKYIFRGHMINYDEMYDTPELIKLKFETLSKRLGIKLSLREDLVNYFGYQFLYTHKDIDKALFYFKMNVENYPLSSNAFDSLGEAYMESGNKLKAIENYEKALQLDQNNVNSKNMLEKFKSN